MDTDITKQMIAAGIKAIKAYPKTQLWAKANSENDFAIPTSRIAHDSIVGELDKHLDEDDWIKWFNKACKNDCAILNRIARDCASKVYQEINAGEKTS